MTTAARTRTESTAHWYYTDGLPCYELAKKDGSGMKNPTLADARKLNLLPSVTNILQVLDKPALNDWKVEQGVLAVLTTPRLPGEADDAFVHRVLHVEQVQNQEAKSARDKGTEIHKAMEMLFDGEACDPAMLPWVEAPTRAILGRANRVTSEKILVGLGYAGKTDLIQESPECWWLWDMKSTKSLPDPKKGAWIEHQLQLAAYAAAFECMINPPKPPTDLKVKPIRTANCYISSIEPGKFVICEHDADWQKTYNQGFKPLVQYWGWLKGYKAQQ